MTPDEALEAAAIVAGLAVTGLVSWRLGWVAGFRKAALDRPRPALKPNEEWSIDV